MIKLNLVLQNEVMLDYFLHLNPCVLFYYYFFIILFEFDPKVL